MGFPGGSAGKEPTCQCRICKRCSFSPWVGKLSRRREWQCSPMQSHEQRSLASYGSQRVGPNWMTNVVEATCGRAVWRVKKPPSEGVDKRLTWPGSPSSSERQRWLADCSGHSKDGRMNSSQIESLCTLVICLFSWKGIGSELGARRRDFRELSWVRGPAVLKEAQLQVWRPADRPGRTSQAGWAVERGQMTQPQYCSGQPFPSPGGSFQPRDWTQVSRIAGGFFTSCATREAQEYWSGQPFPYPGDLPNPGVEPGSPALQTGCLPAELSEKPLHWQEMALYHCEQGSSFQ